MLKNYYDISWMMSAIDLDSLFKKMGWKIVDDNGTHLISYCPDHKYFTKREPSDPKWYLEKKTGKTYCFTEGRGSNLLYTVSRVKKLHHVAVEAFLLGQDISPMELKFLQLERKMASLTEKGKKKPAEAKQEA